MFEGQQRGQCVWSIVSEREVGASVAGVTGGRIK